MFGLQHLESGPTVFVIGRPILQRLETHLLMQMGFIWKLRKNRGSLFVKVPPVTIFKTVWTVHTARATSPLQHWWYGAFLKRIMLRRKKFQLRYCWTQVHFHWPVFLECQNEKMGIAIALCVHCCIGEVLDTGETSNLFCFSIHNYSKHVSFNWTYMVNAYSAPCLFWYRSRNLIF